MSEITENPTTEIERTTRRKRKSKKQVFTKKFTVIYLSVMATLLVCICISLIVFWNVLANYEKGLPDNTAILVFNEYFKELDIEKLYEHEKLFISEFETIDDYSAYLSEKAGTGERSFRHIPTGTADIKKYAVFSDDLRFAEFELIQKEKSGWELISLNTIFERVEDFDIVVPDGSVVYLNGNLVGDEHKAGNFTATKFEGTQTRYTIQNLISEPLVEVSYEKGEDKRQLSYNNEKNEYSDTRTVTVDILDGGRLYINGSEINDSYLIKDGIKTPEASRLNLTYKRYRVTGNLGEPVIRIENKNGTDGSFTSGERLTFVHEIIYDDGLEEQFGSLAENAAKTYATYMTNDSSMTEIRRYFESGTEVYEGIRTSEVIWYTNHISYRFENVKSSEFFEHGEGVYSCRVTLDHYIQRTVADTRHFPLDVTLFFREVGGRYLVFDMVSNA